MRHSPMRRLSSQIFVSQVAILTATVLVGFALFAYKERKQLDWQYEERAVAIAHTVADMPEIQDCLAGAVPATCNAEVQQLAQQVRADSGAAFVVVVDMDRCGTRTRIGADRPEGLRGDRITADAVGPTRRIGRRPTQGADVGPEA